jgi:hypothetical protein
VRRSGQAEYFEYVGDIRAAIEAVQDDHGKACVGDVRRALQAMDPKKPPAEVRARAHARPRTRARARTHARTRTQVDAIVRTLFNLGADAPLPPLDQSTRDFAVVLLARLKHVTACRSTKKPEVARAVDCDADFDEDEPAADAGAASAGPFGATARLMPVREPSRSAAQPLQRGVSSAGAVASALKPQSSVARASAPGGGADDADAAGQDGGECEGGDGEGDEGFFPRDVEPDPFLMRLGRKLGVRPCRRTVTRCEQHGVVGSCSVPRTGQFHAEGSAVPRRG